MTANRLAGPAGLAGAPTYAVAGVGQANAQVDADALASAGADWQTNPATQIRWGLGYIKELYGSPCGAWDHELAVGAY